MAVLLFLSALLPLIPCRAVPGRAVVAVVADEGGHGGAGRSEGLQAVAGWESVESTGWKRGEGETGTHTACRDIPHAALLSWSSALCWCCTVAACVCLSSYLSSLLLAYR